MSINPVPGFNPTQISGVIAWFDASDTTTYTPSATITTWSNKGSAGGVATSTGSGAVSSTAATINRIPAMSFAAAAVMTVPSLTYTSTSRSVFAVVRAGASGVFRTYFGNTATTNKLNANLTEGVANLGFATSLANLFLAPIRTTVGYTNSTSVLSGHNYLVTGSIYGGGLFVNGVAQTLSVNTPQALNTGTMANATMGGSITSAFVMGELLVYDSSLTPEQRQQVEGYLALKWGIQGMTTSYTLSNGVSLVTADLTKYPLDVKALQLPLAQPSVERVVYTKAFPAYFTNSILQIRPTASETINGNASYNLSTSYALSIQASGTNWGILNRYPALLNNYTATQISSSTSVFASTNTSLIFVNLTNQRKTVVLPQISQISPNSSLSMTYTIKDINGMAAFSTLFVTTSGSDLIESYAQPILAIDDNYAAVDLVAQRQTNTWLITNYYYGNL
jgi:hypothetical protein